MSNRPDFICIGPEKTATTWLFSVLEGHAEIWLPPYKELRFLTEGNLVPEHSMKNLLFSSHWHCKELRRILLHSTAKLCLLKKTGEFSAFEAYWWVLRYMFGHHSFAWYDSLFSHEQGLITGDITPNYYHIPEARVKELFTHNPASKVILFVRNPIDRAWSAALMNYCQHDERNFESVSEEEWITMLDDIFKLWTPYPEVIQRWRKYFPNMHVTYFDKLQSNPDSFMLDVTGYLNISLAETEKVNKVVGKGVGRAMPEQIRLYLQQQYEDEIQVMASMQGSGYASGWLKR